MVDRCIDGVVVMAKHSLICKSCVADADLILPERYVWYTSAIASGIQDAFLFCIVCEDKECGPWVDVKYLEIAPLPTE